MAPALGIDVVEDHHQLRWCGEFEGFHVESSGILEDQWQAAPLPVERTPTDWTVAVPKEGSLRFYRLAKP
jgi:hypothetical protein